MDETSQGTSTMPQVYQPILEQRKNCSKCTKEKDLTDFHIDKHGKYGRYYICKECRKPIIKAWQPTYRERHAEASRRYRSRYPERARQSAYKHRRNNYVRQSAHTAVYSALKSHKLEKTACQICGEKYVEGHHWKGYKKQHRLDVLWLCRQHHKDAHAGLIDLEELNNEQSRV